MDFGEGQSPQGHFSVCGAEDYNIITKLKHGKRSVSVSNKLPKISE
jgi:hypothetical protein